jgi:hypothetical protein
MIAVAPVISLATGYRMGTRHLDVWSRRSPELLGLWLEAWEPVPESKDAANAFHETLMTTAREATQAAVDEVQRGIDDLHAWTRSVDVPAADTSD